MPEIGQQREGRVLIAGNVCQRQRLPWCACGETAPHQHQQEQDGEEVVPETLQRALAAAAYNWPGGKGRRAEGRSRGDRVGSGRETRVMPVVRHCAVKGLIGCENWRVVQ